MVPRKVATSKQYLGKKNIREMSTVRYRRLCSIGRWRIPPLPGDVISVRRARVGLNAPEKAVVDGRTKADGEGEADQVDPQGGELLKEHHLCREPNY